VEGLRARDDVGAIRRETGVCGEGIDEADVRRVRGGFGAGEHGSVRLHADHLVGPIGPGPSRQARSRAQIDDEVWSLDLGEE
jgi:hypothetical protein